MATSVITNPIIGGGGKYKLKSVTRVNIGIGQSETFTPTKNGNLIVYNSDILRVGYHFDKIWLDGVEIQPSHFYKTTFEFDTSSTSNQCTKYVSIPSFGSIKINATSDNQDRSGYIYEYEPMD